MKEKMPKSAVRHALAAAVVAAAYSADAGLRAWDVGDYVQKDLVLHYDAIRNAGASLPHSDTAATWTDLSPSGIAAANQACVYGGSGSWVSNAYVFSGTSCMKLQQSLELGSEFTIQIASEMDMSVDGRTRPVLFSSGSETLQMIVDRSYQAVLESDVLLFRTTEYSGITPGNSPYVNWSDGKYANAAFGDGKAFFTSGTSWPGGTRFVNDDVAMPELAYTFGGRVVGGTSGGRNYCSIGKFHALRIYKRKLTNEELAWNRAIDEIRYRGSDVLPLTNVVVTADDLGRCGVESPGAYAVDESYSFAATNVTVGGCVYAPVGYEVKAWDDESGTWGVGVAHDGSTYLYSTNDCPAKVRLSWRWKMVSGIARYDVGDYVQKDLVLHYDAIRNAGASLPHSDTAATWTDLSPSGIAAANQVCVYGGSGSWVSNAYVFAGTSCMKLQQSLELGSEFTIQIASEMDMSVDGRTRPTIFGVGATMAAGLKDFQMLVDRFDPGTENSMALRWWTETYSGITKGNSPLVDWSDGRYVNAAFGEGRAFFTAGEAWPAGTPFANSGASVPALTYCFGGRCVTGTQGGTNYCSRGKFHALRIYKRKLTNDELAWNRDIDEVRYRGAEPSAPNSVWVATSRRGCVAAESGAYRLVGEYTFTAAAVDAGEATYTPAGCTVETWNAANGAWENPVYRDGASCTLRAADAGAARRLTWNYRSDRGFMIILR